MTQLTKVLIANRGEIACRVARTCASLGIKSVAVFSSADSQAQHVKACDESVFIGPAEANQSYLSVEKIIAAAKRTGAQAIHPGYGFLSENAELARKCEANNLVFIGPPTSAIELMGSKSAAKQTMETAGVPLVPGYHGDDQSLDILIAEANAIGLPVMIKASAGGGGKGMRRVDQPDELAAAIESAKREALSAFGDDHVLVEKFITRPRHVEVQVFADQQGNAVHLFERDCSIQRRHQKVVEEAPAPGLSVETKERLGQAAVDAAKAINYVGAGTVEFILDTTTGEFYFMEMNTRLQVEHPVTEFITGQDLVAWQLAVAAGDSLPMAQEELSITGHAMEVRVYAENPDNQFLPATGRIQFLQWPEAQPWLRLDFGVEAGDEVSRFYDPMLGKLIVWGETREVAARRLQNALQQLRLTGVTTNIDFLSRIIAVDAFHQGDVHTGFIEQFSDQLVSQNQLTAESVALGAVFELVHRQHQHITDPWDLIQGWRMNQDNSHAVSFLSSTLQNEEAVVEAICHYRDNHSFDIEWDGHQFFASEVEFDAAKSLLKLQLLDRQSEHQTYYQVQVVVEGDDLHFWYPHHVILSIYDPVAKVMADENPDTGLQAPMPGMVLSVLVEAGAEIESGQPLMVLEAMKMEHTIVAGHEGTVTEIFYGEGDTVTEGDELLAIEVEA